MPSGPWHFLLLSVCLPLIRGETSFPQHMKKAKVDETVDLTCNTHVQGPVSWKHNQSGSVTNVVETPFIIIQDKNLTLTAVDTPSTGEYSCWQGEKKLGETYLLLIEKDDENSEKESLSCSAQTYSCSFRCTWSLPSFTAARLTYFRDGQNSTPWVYPDSKKSNEETFEFTLNLSSSPFAEESAPLVLIGEAMSSTFYQRHVRTFFLRDIVQPEPPRKVQCKKLGNNLSVIVQPASSWAQPLSYFPLMHQIEFEYQDNGMIVQSINSTIPKEISRLRVRSRDPLVPSPWSQWSPWKNVTN